MHTLHGHTVMCVIAEDTHCNYELYYTLLQAHVCKLYSLVVISKSLPRFCSELEPAGANVSDKRCDHGVGTGDKKELNKDLRHTAGTAFL